MTIRSCRSEVDCEYGAGPTGWGMSGLDELEMGKPTDSPGTFAWGGWAWVGFERQNRAVGSLAPPCELLYEVVRELGNWLSGLATPSTIYRWQASSTRVADVVVGNRRGPDRAALNAKEPV